MDMDMDLDLNLDLIFYLEGNPLVAVAAKHLSCS